MSKTALDAKRLNAFSMNPADLTLVTDPRDPLYDERVNLPVDEALVRNILLLGVKVAVLVAKSGDLVKVVDGRQRVKAAVEANRRLAAQGYDPIFVKVIIERGDDADLAGVMIATNELRQQDSVMVKAQKAQRLLNMGRDEETIAKIFGVTEGTIGNWLKLLELEPVVQKAVSAGKVTMTAALGVHGKPADVQRSVISKPTAAPTSKTESGSTKPVSAKPRRPQLTKEARQGMARVLECMPDILKVAAETGSSQEAEATKKLKRQSVEAFVAWLRATSEWAEATSKS